MKNLPLSALSSALFSVGLLGYASSAQALACSTPYKYLMNQNERVENCQVNMNFADVNSTNWIYANQSTLAINNSNISASSTGKEFNRIVQAVNSTVNIANSTLNINTEFGNVVEVDNSTLTIKDSQLSASNINELGGVVELRNQSVATITNSTLTSNEDAFVFSELNNKLTVTDSQVNAKGLLGSVWRDQNSTASLDLTINNTTVNTSVISYANAVDKENNTIDTENLTITATNSNLSGVIGVDTTDTYSNYTVSLTNTHWTTAPYTFVDEEDNTSLTLENRVNNLSLNNSTVNLSKVDGFQTITILNELAGSGNFTLNTDLASQTGDKIVVNGKDSGSFGLSVQDSGNEPQAANGSVTLVETQTGTAQFSLLGRDYVDAGAYRYRLNKSGNNWVLSNRESEKGNGSTSNNVANNAKNSTASNNAGTTTSGNTSSNTANSNNANNVVLSEKSNALVSLRQAQLLLVENNLAGLHQRLGELKKGEQGNVWVRNFNNHNKLGSLAVADNAQTSGFKQRINSTQVGADVAATESIRLGGFVGNARSNVNFEGEYGSGKVRGQAVGLYGTYLADNGFYMDNIVKYERLKADSATTGERKYNAYTLSSEIGRIHTLGSWTITPQLQAAWTRLSAQDDEERLTALTARAGVRVGNQLQVGEWQLQPYAEVNGITTKTNSNAVQVNQYRFDVAESRGRIQTALGVNAALGQHRVGLEGSVANGKHLDQPYQVQAVYRYSW